MFICQNCNRNVPPRTKCEKIVVEKRDKRYPRRSKANVGHLRKEGAFAKSRDRFCDLGGEGFETSKEIIVCPECAIKLRESNVCK